MSQEGQQMDGDALRKVVNMIKDIEFQVKDFDLYTSSDKKKPLITRI